MTTNEIAHSDMYVVETALEDEQNQVRVKLAYEKDAMRLSKNSPSWTSYSPYGYGQSCWAPKPEECKELLTILVPVAMVHEFDVGDKIRLTISKEDQ